MKLGKRRRPPDRKHRTTAGSRDEPRPNRLNKKLGRTLETKPAPLDSAAPPTQVEGFDGGDNQQTPRKPIDSLLRRKLVATAVADYLERTPEEHLTLGDPWFVVHEALEGRLMHLDDRELEGVLRSNGYQIIRKCDDDELARTPQIHHRRVVRELRQAINSWAPPIRYRSESTLRKRVLRFIACGESMAEPTAKPSGKDAVAALVSVVEEEPKIKKSEAIGRVYRQFGFELSWSTIEKQWPAAMALLTSKE